MDYTVTIDDSLVPACDAYTENQCETRNSDGSVCTTRYPNGFSDVLQDLANKQADAILQALIASGPADLLPESIQAAAKEHTDAVAAVAATQDAITTARKEMSQVVREVVPVAQVADPAIKEDPGVITQRTK
jgi:hypothetical protein